MNPGPRLFGIVAARAPVVAVLRRGPSDWCHVGRWDLVALRYEPGAWLRGTIYPQKCDVSPDGRWLAYSALDYPGDRWAGGAIFEAVSRLPWLHALCAWNVGSTYTRGLHFTDEPGTCPFGPPDVGDASPLLRRYGLAATRAIQFAVERRNGWVEAPDSEPRSANDSWDERREARMEKERPGGGVRLRVEGSYAAFRDSPDQRDPALYWLARGDAYEELAGVQWADWDSAGRLLIATTEGRIQVRQLERDTFRTVFDEDLAALRPDPQPPPEWAHEW